MFWQQKKNVKQKIILPINLPINDCFGLGGRSLTTIIVGTQFGDEGKGKITDFLSEQSDWVVRYAGGNNAGHTVIVGDTTYKFHCLPSGLARNKKSCIGAGCVIDPKVLVHEISQFNGNTGKLPLFIDPRAQVILPYHVLQDLAGEQKAGEKKIGTTGRGIGPCYSDRALRIGIRFGDFVSPEQFKKKLEVLYAHKKPLLEQSYDQSDVPTPEAIFEELLPFAKQLAPFMSDVSQQIDSALQSNQKVLFEGAQGTFLDNDFGTYPFVTSSHPLAAHAFVGTGVGPVSNSRIIGVGKAYVTRVGSGPFPTELKDDLGERIRQTGKEFGTTTGRPRRCGWLDFPQLRTAKRLNGLTELALMKLDVLSGLDEVLVCTHYELDGKKLSDVPIDLEEFEAAKPVYQFFNRFEIDSKTKSFEKLAKPAQEFVRLIEHELAIPVSMISIGPERSETIIR